MNHLSNEGTQCIPQKVLTLSREVDECKALMHGKNRSVAATVAFLVGPVRHFSPSHWMSFIARNEG